MNLADETFSLAEASTASAMPSGSIKAHLHVTGRVIGADRITGGRSEGTRRRFSWFNLMEFALAAEIIKDCHARPDLAFKLAAAFAHTGTGGEPPRLPGHPFNPREGQTLLIGNDEHAHVFLDRQVRWPYGGARIVADCSEVFLAVCGRLDLDARAILEAAYG